MKEEPVRIKQLLSKKTIVSGSIGSLVALAGGIYVASDKVQATVYQVAANTQSIESIKINRVREFIADLKKERRSIRRELRQDHNDPELLEELEEVNDAIKAAEMLLECMLDPETEVCE
jgi:flagellar motility protein MotE (MotC chaperone)